MSKNVIKWVAPIVSALICLGLTKGFADFFLLYSFFFGVYFCGIEVGFQEGLELAVKNIEEKPPLPKHEKAIRELVSICDDASYVLDNAGYNEYAGAMDREVSEVIKGVGEVKKIRWVLQRKSDGKFFSFTRKRIERGGEYIVDEYSRYIGRAAIYDKKWAAEDDMIHGKERVLRIEIAHGLRHIV